MMNLCRTASRGRIACVLGGVLGGVLALACLWAFSPSVSAGDDPLVKKDAKGKDCVILPPPAVAKEGPAKAGSLPALPPVVQTVPIPTGEVKPAVETALPMEPPLPPQPSAPPSAVGPPPPPTPPAVGQLVLPPDSPPPPPVATREPPPVPAAEPDIKQLVVQLSQLRADRAQLDAREKLTIQSIRRKYQDQKRGLEQLERELRQMGINCEETAAENPTTPTETGYPRRTR